MTEPLASIDDLQARLGITIDDPTAIAQAGARLADASAIVRAYAGCTWVDEAVPDEVAGVVASMVERATRNPAGVTQEQAGPFLRSFSVDAGNRLYMTAPERAVIRVAAGRSQLATITLTREGPDGVLETPSVIDETGWLIGDSDPVWNGPLG